MPRRRRRFSWLSFTYFVVTAGVLIGGSVWLDRHGETAQAVVKEKHEEITVHHAPLAGWDRWYRVAVEFTTRDGGQSMATLNLPRARYDALRLGDSVAIHYPPFFPLIARAADRTTLQAIGDAGTRMGADAFLVPLLLWLLAGLVGLWLASRIATALIAVVGSAWIVAAFMFLFPGGVAPTGGPAASTARVQEVTLITKAPARRTARRSRSGDIFGDVRRLAVPYQVAQLVVAIPGGDSVLAVDAVDSGSVAGLERGAVVPVRFDPGDPRGARLAGGRRSFLQSNRYHFRTPIIGLALLGMLGAWGARAGRIRKRREVRPAQPPAAGAGGGAAGAV